MANKLLLKRGTRTNFTGLVNANAGAGALNAGELYYITDESRIVIGTGSNTYQDHAKTNDTHYIGTTSVALNRASANLALTGISSVALPGSTSGTITLIPTAIAGTNTITLPAATGTVALTSDITTPNNGTLTLSIGAAAATNNTVTIGTGTGFSANTASNSTYSVSVGPALTNLAALMTTAGVGFIKRGATADTYTIDTSTYITGNQSISVTGDATGTGTTSISLTLGTVNTNVGTFTKLTVNGKGLVTAATTLTATDIPTLTASKISDFDTQVRTSTVAQLAAPAAALAMNSQKITGLAEPTAAQDAATKNYVDSVAQGLDIKPSVRAATPAGTNITLSGTQTIDGVTLVANDRVLVKNQTTTTENGIWVVSAGAWSRALDADTWNELISAFTFVEEGSTNADTSWVFTGNAGGTIGVTGITVAQFGAATGVVAGNGLTSTGNTLDVVGTANRISVAADSIDISTSYVGQTSITTLGTIGTGTWNGTVIGVSYGGLGTIAITGLVKGSGTAYSAAVDGTDYLSPNATIDGGTF
jgi:hypothetical protein